MPTDLFSVNWACDLKPGHSLGPVKDDILGVRGDAVELDRVGHVDIAQIGPPLGDADLEEEASCKWQNFR